MAKKKAKAKRKTTKRKTRAKTPAKTKTKTKTKKKAKVAKAKKPKNLATRAKAELKRNPKSQKRRNVRLTPKQILFVDCYLGAAKRTATLAAEMAGYSKASAVSQGSQLLHNPHVAAYLKKRQSDLARRLEITEEKIAKEMAVLAFSKPTDYLKWRNGKLYLTDSQEIPGCLVGAIKGLKPLFDKHGHSLGIEISFYDKVAAAKLLAQYLGMLEDKGRANNKGIIIKFMDGVHDQAKALGKGSDDDKASA